LQIAVASAPQLTSRLFIIARQRQRIRTSTHKIVRTGSATGAPAAASAAIARRIAAHRHRKRAAKSARASPILLTFSI
jgi:hypothetical protein